MHTFTIEKGVPIPPRNPGGRKKGLTDVSGIMHAFRHMKPGDCMKTTYAYSGSIRSMLRRIENEKRRGFITRLVEGRVWIWRTA